MANRYANLVGSNKIKDEYGKINAGFDAVQAEMDAKPDTSIAQVNDIEFDADDTLTVEGGTGITVTTTPAEKKLRITATGTAAPGAHGIEHNHDGSDPIPELVQVRDDLTALLAETVDKFPKRGFWEDVEPGANIWRFGDRVLVGDAVDQDGNKYPTVRSWVGVSANGYMTYFDSRSEMEVISKIGGIGVASASRSSDDDRLGERTTMGFASYVINDNENTSDKKSAWAYYGHAVHSKDNFFTVGLELDVCNVSGASFVGVNPYSMGEGGTTAGAWIGVGGETVQSGIPSTSYVSVALGIITSAPSDPYSKFAKGIVFHAAAIEGTDGVTGTGIAIEMAKGHEITWKYSGGVNAWGGKIRSDVGIAHNHTRLVFDNSGFLVKGVQSDLSTELTLFKVAPNNSAVNFPAIYASSLGNAIQFAAEGSDANIDITLKPKGSGVIDYAKNASAATTPSNFSATHYLPIKANGTMYYIPLRETPW